MLYVVKPAPSAALGAWELAKIDLANLTGNTENLHKANMSDYCVDFFAVFFAALPCPMMRS